MFPVTVCDIFAQSDDDIELAVPATEYPAQINSSDGVSKPPQMGSNSMAQSAPEPESDGGKKRKKKVKY